MSPYAATPASASDKKDGQLNNTLLIEDLEFARDHLVMLLQSSNFMNLVAPASLEQCVDAVETGSYKRAVIDFNLSDWVGKNQNAILVGEREIYDGVELAEALRERDTDIGIALYSSHNDNLKDKLKKSHLTRVELLQYTGRDPNQRIVDFMSRSHHLELAVRPLHDPTLPVPEVIESFYTSRLLETKTRGKQVWTAGQYAWFVGVNEPPPYSRKENGDLFYDQSRDEKFTMTLDRKTFRIDTISGINLTKGVSMLNPFENDPRSATSTREILLLSRALADHYVNNPEQRSRVLEALKGMDDVAKFESQKCVYKLFAESSGDTAKEYIYDRMAPLHFAGFPKILDIFQCRIDSVEDELAHVKCESLSPVQPVRKDTFTTEFLRQNHVTDGMFELTVWGPRVGGTAYHIQPV